VRDCPTITLAQGQAALPYDFDHQEEIERAIVDRVNSAAEMREKTGPSRLQAKLKAPQADASDGSVSSVSQGPARHPKDRASGVEFLRRSGKLTSGGEPRDEVGMFWSGAAPVDR
jgi:hypothetical protein